MNLYIKTLLSFLSALTLVSPLSAADAPKGSPAKLILAVKDVAAWPNLNRLPDGTFVATIFNKPSHGQVEGDVECWASKDGGLSWTLASTPARHEPGTNRMNVTVGLAKNGDFLVIASGWSFKEVEGQKVLKSQFGKTILQPWVCRSKDGCKTWQVDKTAFPLDAPDGGLLIPYGDIKIADNGDLLASAYSANGPAGKDYHVYICRSTDDGVTWGVPTPLGASQNCNETALFHLGKGRWLAAARENEKGIWLYSSHDDGRTWPSRVKIADGPRYPAHIMRLNDNRLLVTYGNRTKNKGVDAVFSSDEGKTWTKPQRLANFEGDGGYPASLQRPDGKVLTVFYAKKTQLYDGYQMAAVIWDPSVIKK